MNATEGQMNKLRLFSIVVKPIFFVDDGESLKELNVQPINLNPEDWPNVVAIFEKATAELKSQVERNE